MEDKQLTVLTVTDLIRALQKLPPDTKLGHYDFDTPRGEPLPVTMADYGTDYGEFFIQHLGDETWLCTAYDNQARGEQLSFEE